MVKYGADYGIISDIGGKGKGNEDSAFFQEFYTVFAPGSPKAKAFTYEVILAMVCDGVSGSSKGEEGSTFVIRTLASKILNYFLLNDLDLSQIQPKLIEFIKDTNNDLLKKFNDDVQKGKIPKTTLVGLLILGQYLWAFNIGDSRAFLMRDGQIGQISVDDIGSANHQITQAMGEPQVNPHIYPYMWAFNDKECTIKNFEKNFSFLICSDGLTDKVNADEINKVIAANNDKNLQSKVQDLYDLTISRQIDDNVSIVAVDLSDYFNQLSKIQIIRLKPQ